MQHHNSRTMFITTTNPQTIVKREGLAAAREAKRNLQNQERGSNNTYEIAA